MPPVVEDECLNCSRRVRVSRTRVPRLGPDSEVGLPVAATPRRRSVAATPSSPVAVSLDPPCEKRRRGRRCHLPGPASDFGLRLVFSLLWVSVALHVQSAAPSLEQFHPVGFARGTTNIVKVVGKVDPWPPQIWSSGAGVEISALTNKHELQFVVAADAAPGVRLVRLFNDEGASEPRPFVVGAGREMIEIEPNDHFSSAMAIAELPATINGRLEKSGAVDSFLVRVPTGQSLLASVDSHVLMSRLDAVLRLVSTNGQQLAWNHDFATLDPRLDWRAEAATSVIVQVFGFPFPAAADIKLAGGDGAIYRLHLSVTETQPVPTNEVPSELSLPASVRSYFAEPGARHRFKVKLAKDDWISAAVAAESLGSPVDAWLAVEDSTGKEVTRNDDAEGSLDPALDWKAPEDGDYALVVGALTRNAGPGQYYELTVRRATPDWRASLLASSLVAKTGATNELKLTVTRLRGLTNGLQVVAQKLPEGVTAEPLLVPEKGGELKLNLVVGEAAAAWRGPIQIIAREVSSGAERVIPFKLTGSTTDNGVPGGYRVLLADETDHAWLTVLPKAAPKAATTEAGK